MTGISKKTSHQFRRFPTIFRRLPNVAETVRRCSYDFWGLPKLFQKTTILACFDLIRTGSVAYFRANWIEFVSQAWEPVRDPWDRYLQFAGVRVGRYNIYVVSKLYGFMWTGPGTSALRGIAMKPSALNLVKSSFRSIYAKTIHFLVAKELLENNPVFLRWCT